MSKMFPLPSTFFRCPQLGRTEEDRLKMFAEQASIEIIRNARHDRTTIHWELIEDDQDLQVFSGKDLQAPSGVLTYSSTTQIYATVDEVAELFKSDTPEQFDSYRRNFAQDLLDGSTLYTLAVPTQDNPRHFIGVKWIAVGSPVPAVIKHRDFCAVECRYDFELDGRRGWARCLKSVQLACCPDFESSLGIIRGTYHRLGYVFVETDRPGYLQATLLMQLNTGGHIPKWLAKLSAKRRARSLGEMENFLREKRLCHTEFLCEMDLVEKSNRSRCYLCRRKFGAFGTKYSCRKCGEVICKSCSKTWKIQNKGMGQDMRVCTACSVGRSQLTPSVLGDQQSLSYVSDPSRDTPISIARTPRQLMGHQVQPNVQVSVQSNVFRTPTHAYQQRTAYPESTGRESVSRDTIDDMLEQMEKSDRLEQQMRYEQQNRPYPSPNHSEHYAFSDTGSLNQRSSQPRVRQVYGPVGVTKFRSVNTMARNDLIAIDFSSLNVTADHIKDSLTESTHNSDVLSSPSISEKRRVGMYM